LLDGQEFQQNLYKVYFGAVQLVPIFDSQWQSTTPILASIFTSILVRSGEAFVDTLKLKIVKQHKRVPR